MLSKPLIVDPVPSRPRFRPELEGLRGVAVLLVLLFHAGVPGFAGGFVGVDVFYVLSGFLVVGLLVREVEETGRLNLVRFWARRARRLLPAAALVLIAVAAVMALFAPAALWGRTGLDVLFSGWGVGNFRFASLATDYLHASDDPSLLLHFWSLNVEEQFYVTAALLLGATAWATRALAPERRRRALIGLLAGVTVLSLVVSLWLSLYWPVGAFYLLPTRAWELGAGGLLAVTVTGARRPRDWVPALGLVLVLVAGMAFSSETVFPGVAAVVPVAGAALLIAGSPGTRVGRGLSVRGMRALGRWSYATYLWHWPLLGMVAIFVERDLTVVEAVAVSALSVAVGALTYKFWEDPLRRSARLSSPGRTAGLAGLLMASVTAAGAGLVVLGSPGVVTGTVPAWTTSQISSAVAAGASVRSRLPLDVVPSPYGTELSYPSVYDDGCHQDAGDAPTLTACVFGLPGAAVTVWLVGDSHAAQWFPALEKVSQERGWRLVSLTRSGCPLVDEDVPMRSAPQLPYAACTQWRDLVMARMAQERPDLVVTSGTVEILGAHLPAFQRQLVTLREASGRVLVLGDTPFMTRDVPTCLTAHPLDVTRCAVARAAASDPAMTGMAEAASRAGVAYADPVGWMCTTDRCPAVAGNVMLYADIRHVSVPGSELFAPFVRQAADAALTAVG